MNEREKFERAICELCWVMWRACSAVIDYMRLQITIVSNDDCFCPHRLWQSWPCLWSLCHFSRPQRKILHKPNKNRVASQAQLFFFFWWANLIGPSPKKVETKEAPQNRRVYGKMECLPLLTQLYRWEGEDFGQNIWDYSEVLLGTPLGNTLGTPHPPVQNLKEKITRHFECMMSLPIGSIKFGLG
jgi:hypothetical protein